MSSTRRQCDYCSSTTIAESGRICAVCRDTAALIEESDMNSEETFTDTFAKPHLSNGFTWTLIPKLLELASEEKAGELLPLWLKVDNPRVASSSEKAFSPAGHYGWVSVTGMSMLVARTDDKRARNRWEVPVNLVVQHYEEALSLAATLVDAVHQQRHPHHVGPGTGLSTSVQICRQITAIAMSVREHAVAAIVASTQRARNSSNSVSLFDPYDEIGQLSFLEDAIGALDVGVYQLSIGHRLAVTEDLAETLMFLVYCCYYTDYRKRVQSLLLEVIAKAPSCGGVAWDIASSTRGYIEELLKGGIDSNTSDVLQANERLNLVDAAISELQSDIERYIRNQKTKKRY